MVHPGGHGGQLHQSHSHMVHPGGYDGLLHHPPGYIIQSLTWPHGPWWTVTSITWPHPVGTPLSKWYPPLVNIISLCQLTFSDMILMSSWYQRYGYHMDITSLTMSWYLEGVNIWVSIKHHIKTSNKHQLHVNLMFLFDMKMNLHGVLDLMQLWHPSDI